MSRRRAVPTTGAGISPKRTRLSEDMSNSRNLRDAALGGKDNLGRRNFLSDDDFVSHMDVLNAIETSDETALQTLSLDLNLRANRRDHHSDEYEQRELIVRRGQPFTVTATFSRDFDPATDSVTLQLAYGSRPQESKDTVIRLKMQKEEAAGNDDWYAVYKNHLKTCLELTLLPAADAPVGRYKIYVETSTSRANGEVVTDRREFAETFILLFNAWCKDDEVYMEGEAEKNEYVLNERGRLWQGSATRLAPCAWNYGQFEDVMLEGALYLMDKAELGAPARSNPVHVVRCMSSMSNSNDADGGVLTGKWSDPYPKNTTMPWAWTGSVAIMEEFMRTKKAVKYGQCWVFSALVTSLLRSLGIPTRSVTNFESAHDTDASMTIDYHWNEDDEPIDDLNDSVWNFHVWNESWFRRTDLPDGYDGWQALDSTPQELSDGVMRCGPASVKAIKEGAVYFNYDAPFIFAEVNGDKVHWLVKNDGSMEVLMKECNGVGRNISTKAVGSNARHDLTLDYKYAEGSAEERRSVKRAFRHSSRRGHKVYNVPAPDVAFKLNAPDDVQMGQDFTLTVDLKNLTAEERDVTLRLTAVSSYYTGVSSEQIGTKVFTEKLQPNEGKTCSLEIRANIYEGLLKPDSMVTVYLKGGVHQTGRYYAHMDSFSMVKPALSLKVPDRVVIGEEFELVINFNNPLSIALTNGVFHIEAPGIARSLIIPYKNRVSPGKGLTHTVSLLASRAGSKEIAVNFSCDQMAGLTGDVEVYVKYQASTSPVMVSIS